MVEICAVFADDTYLHYEVEDVFLDLETNMLTIRWNKGNAPLWVKELPGFVFLPEDEDEHGSKYRVKVVIDEGKPATILAGEFCLPYVTFFKYYPKYRLTIGPTRYAHHLKEVKQHLDTYDIPFVEKFTYYEG